MSRSRWSPKEIDSLRREQAARPEGPVVSSTYELRHHGHRSVFTDWWLCRQCSELVAPFVSHGHLR